MNCIKARRRLDMYMDNALSLPENLELLEHLNLCRICKDIFGAEEKLRSLLKRELSEPQPSPELASRIKDALRKAPGKQDATLPWRGWRIAIAAILFISISGLVLFSSGKELPQALATEMVSRHDAVRADFYSVPHPDAIRLSPDSTPNAVEVFKKHESYEAALHDLQPQ